LALWNDGDGIGRNIFIDDRVDEGGRSFKLWVGKRMLYIGCRGLHGTMD
jgi:hypothetical protein